MRFALSCILISSLLAGLAGCRHQVTEEEKKAAEKVPSLDIGEGDNETSDKSEPEKEPEKKDKAESEPAKP